MPARGGSKRFAETPLAQPPDGRQRGTRPDGQRRFAIEEEKIKDGRHVGLDFYDLLIEARGANSMPRYAQTIDFTIR